VTVCGRDRKTSFSNDGGISNSVGDSSNSKAGSAPESEKSRYLKKGTVLVEGMHAFITQCTCILVSQRMLHTTFVSLQRMQTAQSCSSLNQIQESVRVGICQQL